jgi:hypothetical protein
MRRHLFWPLIAVGALLFGLATAAFAVALFSDPLPSGWTAYGPNTHVYWTERVFGDRITSLSWSADSGYLTVSLTTALGAGAAFVAAAKSR